MAGLLVLPTPAKSLQNGSLQASAEKLEQTGPAEKEKICLSATQRKQLASTSEPPLPKRKGTEPSVQITRS